MPSNLNTDEDVLPRDPTAGGFVLTNPEIEPHEPQSAGEFLSAGRELAGLSIADVANRLRMSIKQVDALERGDYAAIPSGIFLRGFVRNYAKAVGVDIEAALKVLERTHTGALSVAATPVVAPAIVAAPVAFEPKGDSLATPKSRAIIAVLLVACLAAVVWYWWQFVRPHRADGGRPLEKEAVVQPTVMPALPMANAVLGSAGDATAAQDVPLANSAANAEKVEKHEKPLNATAADQASSPPALPATPAAPAFAPAAPLSATPVNTDKSAPAADKDAKSKRLGGNGVIGFTFSGESWVEVTDGSGRTVMSRRYKAGEADEIAGRGPFSVVVGNAQSTRMAFNGREFDLVPHTKATVARVTVK
ncbi:MAG: helix-turn-helix domain-containing protein [Aeromicrobium sp.]|nr:helix-turn-helix domain-containing protein [Burkholderiales bacterium]